MSAIMADVSVSAAFASDNAAPAHPNVLAALQRVNDGPMGSYGADPVTERAADAVRSAFDCPGAEVLFTFTGTAANIIALSAATRPWQEIFCSDVAHVLVDEAGGPVRLSGAQLTRLPSDDGLIDPQVLARRVLGRTAVHHSQPRIVSITQSTESGRVWSATAIAEFVGRAHGLGLLVHVDGARIGNAVAALGVDPAEAIGDADIVSVGGTKNGITDIMSMKFPEAGLQYLTLDGHAYMGALWWMSNERFMAMPEDMRRVGVDGFYQLQQATFASPKRKSIPAYEEFVQGGGDLYVPTPEEKQAFADAARPVYEWFTANVEGGQEIFDAMKGAVETANQELDTERARDIQ